MLFPITPEEAAGTRVAPVDALQSPSSLVGALQSTKDAQAATNALTVPMTKAAAAAPRDDRMSSSEEKTSALGGRPQKPSMKKGFLNSQKGKALYPEGSGEGVGSDKGGAFARLMSRCQVVDSHTHKVTQPTAPCSQKPVLLLLRNMRK